MENSLDYIIEPIAKEILKSELNADRFVRKTNKGNNEIYIINYHNSPNVMQEIGRLREVTFATAGGGTGEPVDIDHHDTSAHCYEQLIVYSPEDEEIVGGYRFIDCSKVVGTDPLELSTAHYFNFSEEFLADYLPYTIELGRSWVQPHFQPSNNPRKGIFALDNLWDGVAALFVNNPHIKYLFGKVTMYTSYHPEARDAVLYFMQHFFEDKDRLVNAKHPLPILCDMRSFAEEINEHDFAPAFKILSRYVKERGETVPPLISNYMQLSPSMKAFGTAMNEDFGDVEETGILITIKDIYPQKKHRRIDSYLKEIEERSGEN